VKIISKIDKNKHLDSKQLKLLFIIIQNKIHFFVKIVSEIDKNRLSDSKQLKLLLLLLLLLY
jgi:hypothetical protein